jgi:hypothetical protein
MFIEDLYTPHLLYRLCPASIDANCAWMSSGPNVLSTVERELQTCSAIDSLIS